VALTAAALAAAGAISRPPSTAADTSRLRSISSRWGAQVAKIGTYGCR
jgi:hypothetical protein